MVFRQTTPTVPTLNEIRPYLMMTRLYRLRIGVEVGDRLKDKDLNSNRDRGRV